MHRAILNAGALSVAAFGMINMPACPLLCLGLIALGAIAAHAAALMARQQ